MSRGRSFSPEQLSDRQTLGSAQAFLLLNSHYHVLLVLFALCHLNNRWNRRPESAHFRRCKVEG